MNNDALRNHALTDAQRTKPDDPQPGVWAKCSERLPDLGPEQYEDDGSGMIVARSDDVLIVTALGKRYVAHHYRYPRVTGDTAAGWIVGREFFHLDNHVTHWQPLPNPPNA